MKILNMMSIDLCCAYFVLILSSIRSVISTEALSNLTLISNPPKDPVQFFTQLLESGGFEFVPMSLASVDREYGALDRTVVYRGLTDNDITFITEKNTRKYSNIKENPKVSVTFYLGKLKLEEGPSTWQVRVFGKAVELSAKQISTYWESEPVFAKIRSRICECGKPVDHAELKKAHDALLKAYEDGSDTLPQTQNYTAFKIVPKVWDFYKSDTSSIADRVMYKRKDCEAGWSQYHVAA